jgi:dihydroorotase
MNLTITGATLPDGTTADLFVTDGRFAVEAGTGATVIDAAGLQALPGLVDLHTHLREPGYEQSECTCSTTPAVSATGEVLAMA